jgi:GR25 family glycosyltransferase involved in LPS biosynthesis
VAPLDKSLRHPVCASEQSFFKKDLAFKNMDHQVAFRFKGENAEFVGVDSPFAQEANAQSMLMIEEENAREQETQKITLKGPTEVTKLIDRANVELARAEEQLQEMARQSWEDPRLATDPSFIDMRKRMLKQQGTVQNRVMLLKDQLMAETMENSAPVKEELEKASYDVWYINMNKSEARKNCIERQLHDAGIEKVNRFPAVEIRGMSNHDRKLLQKEKNAEKADAFYLDQLKNLGYGDCIEGGVDFNGTMTHGSQKSNEWHLRSAIIANYCGHKRLLKQLEKDESTSDYIVLLEDDVIIDRKWFKTVVEDFITNFDKKNKKWTMVQIDPFGYKSSEDFVGHFRGKPVWKPQFKAPCSSYWGFQAVIFRKSALPKINEYLATAPAMPIDWLQYKVDDALAFSALVARNPESLSNSNWAGEKEVVLPSFCAKTVMKSTIARQKLTEVMFN